MERSSTEVPEGVLLDGATIVEDGQFSLVIEDPAEPAGPSRKANRKERRDHIRRYPRMVRLAYGFGQWRRAPGGEFISPARPR